MLALPVLLAVEVELAPATLSLLLGVTPGAALALGVAFTPGLAGVTALEEVALTLAADLEEAEERVRDRGVPGANLFGDLVT